MSKSVTVKSPTPSKTPTLSKTPTHLKQVTSKTPNPHHAHHHSHKPGSRAGQAPTPQLVTIRYVIDADVIKCPACLDIFKSPRVLPCGHSLCLECLESLILYTEATRTKTTFQCPVCHKNVIPVETKLPRQKWAYQYPVNATIMRCLRNASTKNPSDSGLHKAFCEICLVNNKTRNCHSYCNVCLQHLCDMCHKYHLLQDDTKDHELVFFGKDDQSESSYSSKKVKVHREEKPRVSADKEKKIRLESRERLVPIGSVVVSQTVTASDSVDEKIVVKLGIFNGKSPTDSATPDFRAVAFLSSTKVALADLGNKKLKVFDISHKTRVELIADLALRANPYHMCRVDENTVAIVTERQNAYHIRLFTVRDKISHFVHRSIDGIPLGIGYLQNILTCSFLEDVALHKYRLSRAQQIKAGVVKHDRAGNDIFRQPSAICSGHWRGIPVIYVADETEFGVNVVAIDGRGDKKAAHFFDMPVAPSRLTNKSANGISKTTKSRLAKSVRGSKKNLFSPNATLDGKNDTNSAKSTRNAQKQNEQGKEKIITVSGRHTFRRIDDFGRTLPDGKGGREIERPPLPNALKKELTLDLSKLKANNDNDDLNVTFTKSTERKSVARVNPKAVERATKTRPVGKVLPQKSGSTINDKTSFGNAESPVNLNSTVTSGSTYGTVAAAVPPKLVLNADSIAVDQHGNIYICMSKANTVHQV